MSVHSSEKPSGRLANALTGGLLGAAAIPLAGLLIGDLMRDKDAGAMRDLMLWVGIVATPLTFLLGALGGLVVHRIMGPELPVPIRPTFGMRCSHWMWLLAGGLAGAAAAALISFPLGFLGIALAPIWVWSGIVMARRVSRSEFALRPLTGAIICAFAATAVMVVALVVATHADAPPKALVMALLTAAILIGSLAYMRLSYEY